MSKPFFRGCWTGRARSSKAVGSPGVLGEAELDQHRDRKSARLDGYFFLSLLVLSISIFFFPSESASSPVACIVGDDGVKRAALARAAAAATR